jgi:hypothetical protein
MPHVAIERALIAAACLAVAAGVAQAQAMYKWVDEKGTTHFSESPPPEDAKTKTKATKVEPKVTPPSSSSAYKDNSEAWRGKDAEFRKRQLERKQQDSASSEDKAKRAHECDRVRTRLANYENSHRIYRDNPDGTRTYMEDAERNAEISRMRDQIKQGCD